ncbi:hypothetical protein OIU84_002413 [Salix udensis]|uniref:Serine aminopeptidase S33 domain-containing protein n=1 Tax=Salix udensis TaxID=889485 RepID=A0AAD6P5B4_9ROSI|nr:hypothetical protein OIU84_002413 [Salix udensis]
MEQENPVRHETEVHFWGNTPEDEYYKQQGIKASRSSYTSPRGLSLFTRSWLPVSTDPPLGVMCMVHGYGNDISWTFQSTAIFLAQMGFACFGLDIEGHASPKGFDGAVLVAPMCKISDNIKPRWPIPDILLFVAKFMPTLAIVPAASILHKSIKVESKVPIAEMNPVRYRGKPRLGTVVELLRVTDCLSQNLRSVTIPFIVLHGSMDVVTDPKVSESLYEEASSEDKTIKIYDGMLHSLLFGETDENIEIVRHDILSWLNGRCRHENVEN